MTDQTRAILRAALTAALLLLGGLALLVSVLFGVSQPADLPDARAEGGFYGGKDFHADIIFARRRGISAGLTLPCGTRTRKL